MTKRISTKRLSYYILHHQVGNIQQRLWSALEKQFPLSSRAFQGYIVSMDENCQKISREFPLHWLVWNNRPAELQELLRTGEVSDHCWLVA